MLDVLQNADSNPSRYNEPAFLPYENLRAELTSSVSIPMLEVGRQASPYSRSERQDSSPTAQLYSYAYNSVAEIISISQNQRLGFDQYGQKAMITNTTTGQGSVFCIQDNHGTFDFFTSNHNIPDNVNNLVVQKDGRQYQASVVTRDPAHDIALIQIQAPEGTFKPLPLRQSALSPGESTVTLGYPHNWGLFASEGKLLGTYGSARNTPSEQDGRPMYVFNGLALEGNSGGPTLDFNGQVAGMEDKANLHNLLLSTDSNQLQSVLNFANNYRANGQRPPALYQPMSGVENYYAQNGGVAPPYYSGGGSLLRQAFQQGYNAILPDNSPVVQAAPPRDSFLDHNALDGNEVGIASHPSTPNFGSYAFRPEQQRTRPLYVQSQPKTGFIGIDRFFDFDDQVRITYGS